jgi:hypothetical protein
MAGILSSKTLQSEHRPKMNDSQYACAALIFVAPYALDTGTGGIIMQPLFSRGAIVGTHLEARERVISEASRIGEKSRGAEEAIHCRFMADLDNEALRGCRELAVAQDREYRRAGGLFDAWLVVADSSRNYDTLRHNEAVTRDPRRTSLITQAV